MDGVPDAREERLEAMKKRCVLPHCIAWHWDWLWLWQCFYISGVARLAFKYLHFFCFVFPGVCLCVCAVCVSVRSCC